MANITADILDEWDNHLGSKLTNFEDEYKTYLQFKNIENKLPKKDLVAKNWINSKEDTSSLYFLFNNMKNKESTTLYKKSDTSNDAYISFLVVSSRFDSFAGVSRHFYFFEFSDIS